MTGSTYHYIEKNEIAIVKAPFCGGQGKTGVEKGPQYMLKNGLEKDLNELGWSTTIEKPLNLDELKIALAKNEITDKFKNTKRPKLVGETTEKIYETTSKMAKDGKFVLTLGGDHSIAIGTVSGVMERYPDLGLIWVDAHADLNTLESTASGNLHGCPVSFLLGLHKDSEYPESFNWVPGKLKPSKIVYIGLRDIDGAEKKIIKQLGIKAFSMYHVDRYGINTVIEMALEHLHPNGGKGPIMCSYDVDAVDPLFVPATGTPVRGGLTLREGLFLAERLAETRNLVALDVVETNPDLAINDIHVADTISAGCAIVRCALGETLL